MIRNKRIKSWSGLWGTGNISGEWEKRHARVGKPVPKGKLAKRFSVDMWFPRFIPALERWEWDSSKTPGSSIEPKRQEQTGFGYQQKLNAWLITRYKQANRIDSKSSIYGRRVINNALEEFWESRVLSILTGVSATQVQTIGPEEEITFETGISMARPWRNTG